MKTNLDSCFNMTKQVCDGMADRGWGRIINISSVNGQKGAFGQTNYSAAKAGMHGFTKALALEVRAQGRHVEHHLAGLHRHQDGDGDSEGSARHQDHSADPDGTPGQAGGSRGAGRVSRRARKRRSSPAPTSPSTAASTCSDAGSPGSCAADRDAAVSLGARMRCASAARTLRDRRAAPAQSTHAIASGHDRRRPVRDRARGAAALACAQQHAAQATRSQRCVDACSRQLPGGNGCARVPQQSVAKPSPAASALRAAGSARSQRPPQPPRPAPRASPRRPARTRGRTRQRRTATATIYQPQVISWPEHRTLNARVAIGITPTGAKAPILGIDRSRLRHADRARRAHGGPDRAAARVGALSVGRRRAGRAIRGAHQGALARWASSACRLRRSCSSLRQQAREAAGGRARQHAAAHLRQRRARRASSCSTASRCWRRSPARRCRSR